MLIHIIVTFFLIIFTTNVCEIPLRQLKFYLAYFLDPRMMASESNMAAISPK